MAPISRKLSFESFRIPRAASPAAGAISATASAAGQLVSAAIPEDRKFVPVKRSMLGKNKFSKTIFYVALLGSTALK